MANAKDSGGKNCGIAELVEKAQPRHNESTTVTASALGPSELPLQYSQRRLSYQPTSAMQ